MATFDVNTYFGTFEIEADAVAFKGGFSVFLDEPDGRVVVAYPAAQVNWIKERKA